MKDDKILLGFVLLETSDKMYLTLDFNFLTSERQKIQIKNEKFTVVRKMNYKEVRKFINKKFLMFVAIIEQKLTHPI